MTGGTPRDFLFALLNQYTALGQSGMRRYEAAVRTIEDPKGEYGLKGFLGDVVGFWYDAASGFLSMPHAMASGVPTLSYVTGTQRGDPADQVTGYAPAQGPLVRTPLQRLGGEEVIGTNKIDMRTSGDQLTVGFQNLHVDGHLAEGHYLGAIHADLQPVVLIHVLVTAAADDGAGGGLEN